MRIPADPDSSIVTGPGAGHCWHCGARLPSRGTVTAVVDGIERSMCCHGCAAVAGLAAVAAFVEAAESTPRVPPSLPAMTRQAAFRIEGMTCASCAWAIRHRLENLAGVSAVSIDVVRRRLDVTFESSRETRQSLIDAVRELGYGIETWPEGDDGRVPARQLAHRDLQRLLVALLCMMQVMMFAVPAYMAQPGEIASDIAQLLRVAQCLLALPVMTFCAWPIYRAAWRDLRGGRIGMDVPVTLGLAVAAGASLWSVAQGEGEVYFDSITMFVALLLGSRWLQGRGLARASAYLEDLAAGHAPDARLLAAWPDSMRTDTVPATALKPGDLILVRAGDILPADGVVLEGASSCSEALLTGESRPVTKRIGDAVFASGVNLEQPMVVRIERVAGKTALSALARLAEAAACQRPILVEHAERAARLFLLAVLAVVVVAAFGWALVDPARIVPVVVAILIITCPCALSMAVPVALAAAQAALARRGVLVTRAAAIETLGRVDHIAFDKTGTLTQGRMRLVRVVPVAAATAGAGEDAEASQRERYMSMAAALEQGVNHPIAEALRRPGMMLPRVTAMRHEAGAGVEGVIDGMRVRFGHPDFAGEGMAQPERNACEVREVCETHEAMERTLNSGSTGSVMVESVSLLADASRPLAWFCFADPLRDDAAAVVARLKADGKSVSLLSGDRPAVAQAVGAELGIEDIRGAMRPEDKRDAVSDMQRDGHLVAMVGDGLNDAPVIAQADVSLAFANASTLAQTHADFIVLSDRLTDLTRAFAISARALSVIRQNLFWALGYNVMAIPVAALGHVSPIWAGVGMAVSSLIVVGNAMRLLPRGPRRSRKTGSQPSSSNALRERQAVLMPASTVAATTAIP